VTLTWSDCNGYQRATADPDTVSAWMWSRLMANAGGRPFMAIGSSAAGHVDTAEGAQHAAELCVAARVAAGRL